MREGQPDLTKDPLPMNKPLMLVSGEDGYGAPLPGSPTGGDPPWEATACLAQLACPHGLTVEEGNPQAHEESHDDEAEAGAVGVDEGKPVDATLQEERHKRLAPNWAEPAWAASIGSLLS